MLVSNRRPVRAVSSYLIALFSLLLASGSVSAMPVFINELHYDNAGADVAEGVELAGSAGTDLQNWRLWFYNGSNGLAYASLPLSGIFTDMQNGFGVLNFAFSGIQNGSPDGVALVDDVDQVQQFISYEGAFTALGGVAVNLLSQDIGIAETSQSPTGFSLQLSGIGAGYSDFQWQSGVSSFGSVNEQQHFYIQPTVQGSVPVGSSGVLLALGLAGLIWRSMAKR